MDKVVMISGASSGIGRSIALELAGPGRKLVLMYFKHKKEAEELAEMCRSKGSSCMLIQADVSSYGELSAAYEELEGLWGGVDILINNAGISSYSLIQDISVEEWDKTFKTNINSAFYTTKLCLPHMISNKWGRIVNIASVWGLVGASCESLYSSTKGALIAFSKACAKELAYSGITVNVLAPGAVDTPMLHQLDDETLEGLAQEIPIGRLIKPEEIATWVGHLVADDAQAITGQVISPNGGWVIY